MILFVRPKDNNQTKPEAKKVLTGRRKKLNRQSSN